MADRKFVAWTRTTCWRGPSSMGQAYIIQKDGLDTPVLNRYIEGKPGAGVCRRETIPPAICCCNSPR